MTREKTAVASLEALDFGEIYDRHFRDVLRWSRALGAPEADLEDLAQQVFLVVHRKLSAFDGRNLRGWLYRITAHTVSDHRRRAWFRHLIGRRSEREPDALVGDAEGPSESAERAQDRERVRRVLAEMTEKRRAVFALFEIEGYSGEEIAEILEVPLGTVWSRLQAARTDFVSRVAALQAREKA